MLRSEIDEKVKDFLINEFEIDEDKIAPEARLREDIGIDSLDLVDIIVIVDRVFGFRIKTEDMATLTTLRQFCDFIEQHAR